MRAVIQRVTEAQVEVDGKVIGQIGPGMLVLLGISKEDGENEVNSMAEKVVNLRFFQDAEGKLNLSIKDVGGEVLVVSQFTLYGDCRKGRRPSYTRAAPGKEARILYEKFIEKLKALGVPVAEGIFQARMLVKIFNEGPVTLILDTDKSFY